MAIEREATQRRGIKPRHLVVALGVVLGTFTALSGIIPLITNQHDESPIQRPVFINVPGQSGEPGSPHYADLASVWSRQDHVPMLYGREAVDAATETIITLTPA